MQGALWAMAAVRYAIDVRRRRSSGPDTLLKSSMEVILFAASLVIWGLALLMALGNLGVKIEPLLAGRGLRGTAPAPAGPPPPGGPRAPGSHCPPPPPPRRGRPLVDAPHG